jgi:dihydroorotate dehydrogenase
MKSFYRLARPALMAMDAERAHQLAITSMMRLPRLSTLAWSHRCVEDPVNLLGLSFRNRIGLAAGMDKDGKAITALSRLGFGFIEIGTVTPRPQPGNPKPRMFRIPEAGAVINRLGFNNDGVEACVARVRAAPRECVLGINIGKNLDTPVAKAHEDYVHCLQRAHPVADYITVNVSSPNTPGLRDLQGEAALKVLLEALAGARRRCADHDGRRVPMLLKVAPDMDEGGFATIARLAREHEVDGLIATNTTVTRPALAGSKVASEAGGLSGAPLAPLAEEAVRRLRAVVGADFPLVGVGGIDSADVAVARITAGADLLQIYTGLVYEGPGLISDLATAVRDRA